MASAQRSVRGRSICSLGSCLYPCSGNLHRCAPEPRSILAQPRPRSILDQPRPRSILAQPRPSGIHAPCDASWHVLATPSGPSWLACGRRTIRARGDAPPSLPTSRRRGRARDLEPRARDLEPRAAPVPALLVRVAGERGDAPLRARGARALPRLCTRAPLAEDSSRDVARLAHGRTHWQDGAARDAYLGAEACPAR